MQIILPKAEQDRSASGAAGAQKAQRPLRKLQQALMPRRVLGLAILSLGLVFGLSSSLAGQDILTYHNDNARTGQNLRETILTLSNVNPSNFGKLLVIPADGKVDAQPLYKSHVLIPGKGAHNVLYVATEHDSVYAFDADTGAELWRSSMLKPGETPSDDRGCMQVTPEIGVTATSVIDPAAGPHGTIYVVAMSKNASGQYFQRLHALDLATGQEEFGGPVDIHATYPGVGDDSRNGKMIFDPKQYKERPGLLLVGHTIITAWSSHCDYRPYTGWIMAYNEYTMKQTGVLNITPNGTEGAFWSSGAGPAADSSGAIYLLAGNGAFDTRLTPAGFPIHGDYGNAFLKVTMNDGDLKVADYFNMANTISETNIDMDLGSGGALVLPDMKDAQGHVVHLAIGAGKDQNIYLVNRDHMGKFDPRRNAIYQEIYRGLDSGEFGMPAYFNGKIYFGAMLDVIRAFQFSHARLLPKPVSVTKNTFSYPGATPSISADGTRDAILWAVDNNNFGDETLCAYDANNLARMLYSSNMASGGRDHFGAGNKFIVPTVANGKVYVGTTNGIGVFGLLPKR
jgi:outer membrane protein assembly factor BamB